MPRPRRGATTRERAVHALVTLRNGTAGPEGRQRPGGEGGGAGGHGRAGGLADTNGGGGVQGGRAAAVALGARRCRRGECVCCPTPRGCSSASATEGETARRGARKSMSMGACKGARLRPRGGGECGGRERAPQPQRTRRQQAQQRRTRIVRRRRDNRSDERSGGTGPAVKQPSRRAITQEPAACVRYPPTRARRRGAGSVDGAAAAAALTVRDASLGGSTTGSRRWRSAGQRTQHSDDVGARPLDDLEGVAHERAHQPRVAPGRATARGEERTRERGRAYHAQLGLAAQCRRHPTALCI